MENCLHYPLQEERLQYCQLNKRVTSRMYLSVEFENLRAMVRYFLLELFLQKTSHMYGIFTFLAIYSLAITYSTSLHPINHNHTNNSCGQLRVQYIYYTKVSFKQIIGKYGTDMELWV